MPSVSADAESTDRLSGSSTAPPRQRHPMQVGRSCILRDRVSASRSIRVPSSPISHPHVISMLLIQRPGPPGPNVRASSVGRKRTHAECLLHDVDHQRPGSLVVPPQGHEHLRGGRNHGAVLFRPGVGGRGEILGGVRGQRGSQLARRMERAEQMIGPSCWAGVRGELDAQSRRDGGDRLATDRGVRHRAGSRLASKGQRGGGRGAGPAADGPVGAVARQSPAVEYPGGAVYVEDAEDVEGFILNFAGLTQRALGPAESAELIREIAEAGWTRSK